MKKIFFLMAFLFAVVCFASPPPGLVPNPVTAQCAYVVQDNVDVAVYTVEVQPMAFVYLNQYQIRTCITAAAEKGKDIAVPKVKDTEISFMGNRNFKPPLIFSCNNQVAYNSKLNLINTNFGYQYIGDNKI